MLEFEDVPMKAEVNAPAGFVVVPLEQYNELLLAAAQVPCIPIKTRKTGWNGGETIEAEVDAEWLLAAAHEQLVQRYSAEDLAGYDMMYPDDVYNPSIVVAKRKPAPAPPEEPEEL